MKRDDDFFDTSELPSSDRQPASWAQSKASAAWSYARSQLSRLSSIPPEVRSAIDVVLLCGASSLLPSCSSYIASGYVGLAGMSTALSAFYHFVSEPDDGSEKTPRASTGGDLRGEPDHLAGAIRGGTDLVGAALAYGLGIGALESCGVGSICGTVASRMYDRHRPSCQGQR